MESLPTPAEAMKRVNAMSRKKRSSNKLTFQYRDLSEVQYDPSDNATTVGLHDDTNEDYYNYSNSRRSDSNSSSNNNSNSDNSDGEEYDNESVTDDADKI